MHQPTTFDYFEHQPITDKWAEREASVHVRVRTIKTIFVAENSHSSARKCFQANDSQLRGYFTRAIRWLSQIKTHVKGELFFLKRCLKTLD